MPHINRVRVNNVKYNFGTQYYDDFHMGFYGKNTIYDLANGGGKSMLMLLLLQNLIPNCTLDEKQPVEKLFRSGNGNTTIHSMIEWKLSDVFVKNNYKYMLTGFCARKARDNSLVEELEAETEESENATIEYFNYCIFYREFNDHDIKNFPLSQGNERMSYGNLKNYLKDLAKKDLSLEIKIFERKGEYQKFISQYGLYESEWEIIRGINKTEGHVRTYFESNYKTTRKVVEDLLIEEIIQKSFNNRIENDGTDDYMAKTLLDIKDKLIELSRKKEDIASYERQIEVIDGFVARMLPIKQMYFGSEKLGDEIVKSVNSLKFTIDENNNKLENLEEQLEDIKRKKSIAEYEIEGAKIVRLTKEEEEFVKKISELTEKKKSKDEVAAELKEKLKIYESINNYDDYLYYKKERDIQKNIIDGALKDKGDIIAELRILAGAKHKLNRNKLAYLDEEIEKCESIIEKEENVCVEIEERLAQVQKELAVTEYLKTEYSHKENSLSERIKSKMDETEIYFTTGIEGQVLEAKKDMEEHFSRLGYVKEEFEKINDEILKTQSELKECDRDLDGIDIKIMELSDKRAGLIEVSEKIERIGEVYGEKNLENLGALIKIKFEEVSEELEAGKKELLSKASYRRFLEQGSPVGNSKEMQKVLEYIERFHGKVAVAGSHYMTTLTKSEKEEVLERIPFLPYSVIVKDNYEQIISDAGLKELDLGNYTVPVIKASVILGIDKVIDYANTYFVMYKNQLFIDENVREKEIEKNKAECSNLEEKITKLVEIKNVYENDLTFVREYISIWNQEKISCEEAYEEYRIKRKEVSASREMLNEKIIELRDNLNTSEKLCREIQTAYDNASKQYENVLKMSELIKEESQCSINLRNTVEKNEKLVKESSDLSARYEATCDSIKERQKNCDAFKNQKEEIKKQWSEIYKLYYVSDDGEAVLPDEDMDDVKIDSKFMGLLKVADSGSVDIEDKKKLVENYDIAMEKSLQAIDYKGLDLAYVKEKYDAAPVKNIDTVELISIKNSIDEIESEEKAITKDISVLTSERDKNSGAIAHAKESIREKYGEYEPSMIHIDDYEEFVAGRKAMIREVEKSAGEYVSKMEEANRIIAKSNVLLRDVDKIMRAGNIINDDNENRFDSYVNLEEKVENVINDYEKFNKEVQIKKDEFQKNKEMLVDTITKLGGVMLAEDIKANVVIPNNVHETDELMESLADVSKCLSIEKDRVLKNIEDMEKIKDNFENQCIQTCINIKNELDRLPKLSKIYMEDEPISIISLSIPYVAEEHYKKNMSDYIDETVAAVDNMKTDGEKVKFIRGQLAWKRMFSVIVSDMNRIKLKLYKRERIKEQSRYLRYEEAVGSTGQSQGIYIQFLIAIINYISSINSRNSDGTGLGKVIFIDNPFGAAKDIYIWEPIFKLLKTNNVQMVVPARGATPAITGRFDVNYILGQKFIDGRQQTVVVDYLSNVDSSKLDYKKMEFSQATLF